MNCNRCNKACIKNGFQTNGKQRYFCKGCEIHQQKCYTYKAYKHETNQSIYNLIINSCGITDISRILNIAKNTVTSRISKIAKQIRRPIYIEHQQSYEVDELYTKVAGKPCWISYAINRQSKQIISFILGNRSKENLACVINSLLLLNPKKIYTDKLVQYSSLVPKPIHNNARFQTNRIERLNLTLRTHLKMLHRKTICYCKKVLNLEAIMRIYFWGYGLKFT